MLPWRVEDGQQHAGLHLLLRAKGQDAGMRVAYAPNPASIGGMATESCVAWAGNQAVWTSGGSIRKRFTLEQPILQAAWVRFSPLSNSSSSTRPTSSATSSGNQHEGALFQQGAAGSSNNSKGGGGPGGAGGQQGGRHPPRPAPVPPDSLVFLQGSRLTAYLPSGELLTAPLPAPCAALWPLPEGLLLVGQSNTSVSLLRHPLESPVLVLADSQPPLPPLSDAEPDAAAAPADSDRSGLWGLTPPAAAAGVGPDSTPWSFPPLQPAAATGGGSGGGGSPRLPWSLSCGWQGEEVMWSSWELGLVVTYQPDHNSVSVWHHLPVPPELSQHLQDTAQRHCHLSGDAGTSASPLPSPSPRAGTNQPYMLLNYLQQQPRTPATALLPPLGGPGGAATAQSKGLTTGSLTAGLGWEGVWPGSGQAGVRSRTPGGTSGAMSSYCGASGPPSTVKRGGVRTPEGYLSPAVFQPLPRHLLSTLGGGGGGLGGGPSAPGLAASLPTTAAELGAVSGQHSSYFKLVHRVVLREEAPPSQALLATDAHGGLLLGLLLPGAGSQRLALYRLGEPGSQPSLVTCLPAAAAVALPATATPCAASPFGERLMELLVLLPSGVLRLYCGGTPLLALQVQVPRSGLLGTPAAASAAAPGGDGFGLELRLQQQAGVRAPRSRRSTASSGMDVSMSECDPGEEDQENQEQDMQVSPGTPAFLLNLRTPAGQTLGAGLGPAAAATAAADAAAVLSGQQGGAVCGLSHGQGQSLTLALTGGQQVRAQLALGLSCGVPQQLLQALGEVLPPEQRLRFLGRCLVHPGGSSRLVKQELTAIGAVLLAWADDEALLSADAAVEEGGGGCSSLAAEHTPLQVSLSQLGGGGGGAAAAASGTPLRGSQVPSAVVTPGSASAMSMSLGYTPGGGASDMDMSSVKPSRATAVRSRLSMVGVNPMLPLVQEPQAPGLVTPGSAMPSPGDEDSMDMCTPVAAPRPPTAAAAGAAAAAGVADDALMGGRGPVAAATGPGGTGAVLQEQQQPTQAAAGDAAWKALLQQPDTQQRLQQYPALLAAGATAAAGAGAAIAGVGSSPAAAAAAGSAAGYPGQVAASSEQHRQQLLSVLQALHAVYEDCKLFRSRAPVLPLLAGLLLPLAVKLGAWGYVDHYRRDVSEAACGVDPLAAVEGAVEPAAAAAAAAAGGTSSSSSGSGAGMASNAVPGDIWRALSAMLAGDVGYSRWLPGLVKANSSTVKHSCQVVRCYQLLHACTCQCLSLMASPLAAVVNNARGALSQTRSTPGVDRPAAAAVLEGWPGKLASHCKPNALDLQLAAALRDLVLTYSQQVVLQLSEDGLTVVDLEELPLGVALPLQEALARCRSYPPTGWPAAAYALIGREDIAATVSTADAAAFLQPPVNPSSSLVKPVLLPYARRLTGSGTAAEASDSSSNTAAGGAGSTVGKAGAGSSGPAVGNTTAAGNTAAGGANVPPQGVVAGAQERTAAGAAAAAAAAGAGVGSGAGGDGSKAGGRGAPGVVVLDGMEGVESGSSRLRFSRDGRLGEVRSLLSSATSVHIKLEGMSEADPDTPSKQQAALLAAASRTLSLPLGRGAFALGSATLVPGEMLGVPCLCLSGVMPLGEGRRGVVSLDLNPLKAAEGGGAAADLTAWPEFHNGVAAGLRLAAAFREAPPGTSTLHPLAPGPALGPIPSSSRRQGGRGEGRASRLGYVTGQGWLAYSRPRSPTYAHAGMLLALGLLGQLDGLLVTDIYKYMSDQHPPTMTGLMLGLAASAAGSQDLVVSRTLFFHLPAQHPAHFPEIEVPPQVQAAALLGVGLVYQGTGHPLMAEIMLQEMARRPGLPGIHHLGGCAAAAAGGGLAGALGGGQGVMQEREGYALAAGAALGLITLGRGRRIPGLEDLQLGKRLRALMDASLHPPAATNPAGTSRRGAATRPPPAPMRRAGAPGANPAAAPSLVDAILGPGVLDWREGLGGARGAAPVGRGRVTPGLGRTGDPSDTALNAVVPQVVLEGAGVNAAVTSPAATLALTLMCLKTGDADVASWFSLPASVYELDLLPPSLLTLRVMGRALVMWEEVDATEEWVQQQLTPLLSGSLPALLDRLVAAASKSNSGQPQSNAAAAHPPLGAAARSSTSGRTMSVAAATAVVEAHVAALVGACMALGLRFAGSCHAPAESLLRHYALQLLAAKRRMGVGPEAGVAGAWGKLDRGVLEGAVCNVMVALSCVMAGSGHLPTFRLLQHLSQRLPRTSDPAAAASHPLLGSCQLGYGHHMALGAATGLLFLAAGRAALRTDNEALAALLVALYPHWPSHPSDQRCHLQAFRHLYVLAVERRCVAAVDVDSRQAVAVPLAMAVDPRAHPNPTSNSSSRGGAATTLDMRAAAAAAGGSAADVTAAAAAADAGVSKSEEGKGAEQLQQQQQRVKDGDMPSGAQQQAATAGGPAAAAEAGHVLQHSNRHNVGVSPENRGPSDMLWSPGAPPAPQGDQNRRSGGVPGGGMMPPPPPPLMTPLQRAASAEVRTPAAAAAAAAGGRHPHGMSALRTPTPRGLGWGLGTGAGGAWGPVSGGGYPRSSSRSRTPGSTGRLLPLHPNDVPPGLSGLFAAAAAAAAATGDSPSGALMSPGSTAGLGDEEGSPGDLSDTLGVTVTRVTPCLLPEQHQVGWVQVTGPRYWPQLAETVTSGVTGGPRSTPGGDASVISSSLDMLYQQQLLYVKKKSSALSYAADPSGIRSLLSRAHRPGSGVGSRLLLPFTAPTGGAAAAAAAAAGSEGAQQQQSLQAVGGASHALLTSHLTSDVGDEGCHDVVNLCRTFSADPHITAFAETLVAASIAAAAAAAAAGGNGASSGPASAVAAAVGQAFLLFCHGALTECVAQEKGSLLPAYLHLQALISLIAPVQPPCQDTTTSSSSSSRQDGLQPGNTAALQQLLAAGPAAQRLTGQTGLTAALRNLWLARQYYSSGVAAAAGLVARRSLALGAGAGAEPAAVAAEQEGWLPLLQPAWLDALWSALQQQWQRGGLLPASQSTQQQQQQQQQQQGAPGTGSTASSQPAGTAPADGAGVSGLGLYYQVGSCRAAAQQLVAAAGVTGQEAQQVAWLEQVVGALVVVCGAPSPAQLAAARSQVKARLQQQGQQQQQQLQGVWGMLQQMAGQWQLPEGAGQVAALPTAAVAADGSVPHLQAWAEALPGVPGDTLLLLWGAGLLGA